MLWYRGSGDHPAWPFAPVRNGQQTSPTSLGHVLMQAIQSLTCLLDSDGEAVVVRAALCFDRHVPGAKTYRQGPCVREK